MRHLPCHVTAQYERLAPELAAHRLGSSWFPGRHSTGAPKSANSLRKFSIARGIVLHDVAGDEHRVDRPVAGLGEVSARFSAGRSGFRAAIPLHCRRGAYP